MMTILDDIRDRIDLIGFVILLFLIVPFLLPRIIGWLQLNLYLPVTSWLDWNVRPVLVSRISWGVVLIELGIYLVFGWKGVFVGNIFFVGILLIVCGISKKLRD